MCDHWHEPTNTKLLASALMVSGLTGYNKFSEGEPVKLWKTRYGNYEWTFSYHDNAKPDEVIYHWHSSLVSYGNEAQARETMANFVKGLNAGWRTS